MEETTTPSPEYLKGFNEGYLMAKELPDLADSLSRIRSDSERIKGFQDGRRQLVTEKAREQRKGLTSPTRPKDSRDRSLDKEHDLEK